jgi:hypothetical protein
MGLRPQPFLDVLNTSTERFVARAKFASGQGSSDDARVRVVVRQLPRVAVAIADNPGVLQLAPNAVPVQPPSQPGQPFQQQPIQKMPARAAFPLMPVQPKVNP